MSNSFMSILMYMIICNFIISINITRVTIDKIRMALLHFVLLVNIVICQAVCHKKFNYIHLLGG